MESIEIKVDRLQDSQPVKFTLGSEDVCVARIGDEVFAVADICSHAEASLSEGEISDYKIGCWLHGAEFDLRSGEVLAPPALDAIETFAVVRDGDTVTISKKR
ncbi:MAG: non-heme iron oxygenase ferredoxin subunit [Actinobacteria bacterium]|nr:non-heme iron oxygenase ferredoxin subunit [Actinomycetota bacterium]